MKCNGLMGSGYDVCLTWQHILQVLTSLPSRVRVEEALKPGKATLLREGHSEIKPLGSKVLLALVGRSSRRRSLQNQTILELRILLALVGNSSRRRLLQN